MTPTVENSDFNASIDDTDSDAFDYTCTGSDLTLVIIITWRDVSTSAAPYVDTLTYDGQDLTFKARARVNYAGDNYVIVEIWYIDNPSTGSNEVAYTLSEVADLDIGATCISMTGANNGVGANKGESTGNGTDIDTSFDTDASDSLIIGGIFESAVVAPVFTEDGGTNEEQENSPGTYYTHWGGYKLATGGVDEIGVTSDRSDTWAMAAIEILAAAEIEDEKLPQSKLIRSNQIPIHQLQL